MKTRALWFLLAAVTMIAACDKDDGPTAKNQLPVVAMISPLNWVNYNLYDTLLFVAEATDADGKIENVLFYFDQILVGTDSTMPYQCEKIMTETGTHIIFAKAIDNQGGEAFSDSTNVYSWDPDVPVVKLSYSPFSYHYNEFDSLQFNLAVISPDGKIVSSALFINNHLFGVDTTCPYTFRWDSIPAGEYQIHGTAVDDKGRTGISEVQFLTVHANTPPSIRISYPGGQNIQFAPGQAINIYLEASDPDGPIKYIELYANDQLLTTLEGHQDVFVWGNALSGEYDLVAKAYDDRGGVGISASVRIRVMPGILDDGVISDLIYSSNDDLVFGISQTQNKLLLMNPFDATHTDITLPYSQPIAMDYSIQDQKLYIIYKFTGSISVFDQITQSLSEIEFSVADDGRDICVDALNRRIYVLSTTGLHILDMQNGNVLLNATAIQGASMVIEPNNQWLFTASVSSSASIYKYSVEGDVLNLIQTNSNAGSYSGTISIHPDGDYVVLPCSGGNGPGYTMYAFSTADLNNVLGEFSVGVNPRFAAFSRDGKYLIACNGYENKIHVMNAHTYVKVKQIDVYNLGTYVRMATNYSSGNLTVFSYVEHNQKNHVIYFFDL
jgi:WD40 repeat protein